MAVPNFSEGRSERVIETLEATLGGCARVLNRHFDVEHNRCVFTIAGEPTRLVDALVAGAREALNVIDLRSHQGLHPHVGALDVCPVVWQDEDRHEDAIKAAREAAEGIAGLGIPVFFYGELATSPERTERAYFRKGGPPELARRMKSGELEADLGPSEPHPTAGATLVTAREPLVAFNVELDTPDPDVARAVAAGLREAGGGLAGVRALGLPREVGAVPGLPQRPRPDRRTSGQSDRRDQAARRRARRAAGRGRARRAGARRPPSRATRTTCRSGTSIRGGT